MAASATQLRKFRITPLLVRFVYVLPFRRQQLARVMIAALTDPKVLALLF